MWVAQFYNIYQQCLIQLSLSLSASTARAYPASCGSCSQSQQSLGEGGITNYVYSFFTCHKLAPRRKKKRTNERTNELTNELAKRAFRCQSVKSHFLLFCSPVKVPQQEDQRLKPCWQLMVFLSGPQMLPV